MFSMEHAELLAQSNYFKTEINSRAEEGEPTPHLRFARTLR
jgi:hypothetical protein